METVLTFDPVAAALAACETPGFTQYNLLSLNWWLPGWLSRLLPHVDIEGEPWPPPQGPPPAPQPRGATAGRPSPDVGDR